MPYQQTYQPHTRPSTGWTYFSNGDGQIQVAADEGASVEGEFNASDFNGSGPIRGRGNIFRATTNHFLTSHGIYLGRTNSTTVTLFVLEGTSTNGIFTNIHNSAISASAGTGYVQTNGLSIPLYSGRYYAVGASWSNSSISYPYRSAVVTSYTHGIWVSGFNWFSGSAPTSSTITSANNLYRQRIETSAEGALRLDDSVSVTLTFSTNRATVVADFQGYSKAMLSFRHRARGDENHAEDGVFLSTNNLTYVKILNLGESTSWLSYTVDVAAAAASNSMALSATTYIRFQQMDDWGVPSDGREFDDLKIYSDADIELYSYFMATNFLFRGYSTNKTINIVGLTYRSGGDTAFTNVSPFRYRLLSGATVVAQTNITTTNSFVPFTRVYSSVNHSFVIPAATRLTNIAYTLNGFADATNSLVEGNENNNERNLNLRINHYSGNLYFSNVLTSITIANWGDQPGFTNSLTNHVISGTGTSAGYPFAFTNLKVRKNLATLDYSVDPTETQTVHVASIDPDSYANVDFTRPLGVTLSRTGGRADFYVQLPAGASYGLSLDTQKHLNNITFTNVGVNSIHIPTNNPVSLATRYFSEETKPLKIQANSAQWLVETGAFELVISPGGLTYVRDAFLTTLESLTLAPGLKKYRPSNEQYFREATYTSSSPILIAAGEDGEALMTMELGVNAGSYKAHFPYEADIAWTNGGVSFVDDLVKTAGSQLNGVSDVSLGYLTGCDNGCPGASVVSNIIVRPSSSSLQFTPDGGLHTAGILADPHVLAWGFRPDGKYAQRAGIWYAGNFHMPGHALRGDQRASAVGIDHGPGVMLFTGVSTNGRVVAERFGTIPYAFGSGDHAGVNFRAVSDGQVTGESTLGNDGSGPYPLAGNSKYYARYSGVSGIHQSVFQSFPATAMIYGYPFDFYNYGLNYLSSSNRDSRTDGLVELPYPSDFDIEFDQLRFTCPGDLADAKLPGGSLATNMVYWNAPINISSLAFERNSGCADIGSGYLTIGVATYAQRVTQPLFGKLGIFSKGDLIPASFGLTNVDSRLSLPATIKIAGPNTEQYHFQPITKAYFNTYTNAGAFTNAIEGFVSFAGSMDVPFFQDLLVQFHVPAGTGTVGSLHMMGGWPDAGWESGGNHFFTQPSFDKSNRAWPAAAGSIAGYRAQTNNTYLVRARQSWLNLINLSYPVVWNQAAKSFTSSEQVKNDLFVLNVAHQVDYLSANRAELSFGLQYGNLPSINLANMAVNAVDEATGIAQSFINAAGDEVVGSLDKGLDKLDQLVDNEARRLMDSVLDAMFDPIITSLYTNLAAVHVPGSNYYTAVITNYIKRAAPGGLNHAVRNIATGAGYTTNIVGQVDSGLASIERMLDAIIGTVTIDPVTGATLTVPKPGILNTPGFPLIGDIAESLLQNLAQEIVNALAAELSGEIESAQEQVQPALDSIREVAVRLKSVVSESRTALNGANGYVSELKAAISVADANTLTDVIATDLQSMFGSFPQAHNPFQDYSPAELKAMMRNKIEARLFASPVMSNLTRVNRSWLYDLNTQLREAMDSMFQQVNTMMREVMTGYLSGVDDSISGMLGDLSDAIGTGQIDGYAHITGDSLSELRLDGKFQWNAPSAMEFKGYLLIREIESGGSSGCKYSGGVANTVEIGAKEVGADWLGSDVRIDVAVKFTLVDAFPVGMGGALELVSGKISFEAVEINDFGAAVMFGLYENYLAGRIRAKMSGTQIAGAAFFGRTCTLDPIRLADPDVADVLGSPPFSGIYVYGEAWIPIVDWGCFFNVSAGVGAGFFFFVEGPTIGAKLLLGVSGEAVCVVGVAGEVKLVGTKSGNNLTAKGKGTIRGKVGACPLCVKFSESVSVTFKNGSWDVSF